ncbi:hypothetical protein [Streptococcus cristatus]
MEEIIQSIEQSKSSDNYFAMLTSSLILIELFSSIEYKDEKKQSYNDINHGCGILDSPCFVKGLLIPTLKVSAKLNGRKRESRISFLYLI